MGVRVTVVGAGNAGCAAAADLTVGGATVTLYELPRFAGNLEPVRERGGIRLVSRRLDGTGRQGDARVTRLSTDAAEAARGADAILVATQAAAHEEVARTFAPHLASGQVLLLFTGYAGALAVRKALREASASAGILVAETVTLPYACRLTGPAEVEVHGKLYRAILTAALPAADTERVLERLRPLYPTLVPAANVLETTLLNSNITRHTVGTMLNIGRIEYSKGEFWFYREAFTPAVWRVHGALDGEKMALLETLGLRRRSFWDYRRELSDLTVEDQAASYSKGPSSAETRYLSEDVPMGLVFFASLGERLGVPTPTARALIYLASVSRQADYWGLGRTLARLGLGSLSPTELCAYVEQGSVESRPRAVSRP